MFFPFGGGKTMCPGRTFAKQEVFVALALVVLTFDVEFLGFVDGKRRATNKFPGLRTTYLGSAVLNMDGDAQVRIRPRS